MQTAFITGCATGFGARLAARLLDDGWAVIATDPDLTALDSLDHEHCLRAELDVRDAAQVAEVVGKALAWRPVDVLVNNGGYAVFGSQEAIDPDAVRDLFDVNVFGTARVTRALLPTLRDRAGTVVQLSSVAGRTVFPESGWYAATKYAVEALSEALYQETCSFGVKLRVVEPGSFNTQFIHRAVAASPPRDPASPYAHLHAVWDARKTEVLEAPQDPALVVNAIVEALADEASFRRVVVGPDSERILALRELLGADEWTRHAGQRNGGPAQAFEGDVQSPRAVLACWSQLAADPDAFVEALEPTLFALRFGHLGHWRETEDGQAALAILHRVIGQSD